MEPQNAEGKLVKRLVKTLLAGLLLSTTAFAVPPDEQLDDPVLEAQAREISKGLRCLVCQNQSIDDSDADLAKDLRRIVRERLLAGDNEAAIEDYVVSRYGEFVLLKPRLSTSTALLWGSPLLFIIIGIGFAGMSFRRQGPDQGLQETVSIPLENNDILNHLRDG